MTQHSLSGTPLTTKRLYRADGSPRPVGVIGHPVAHSLSPIFQDVAFVHHNLPHRYQKWDVAPANLAAFLAEMRQQDFLGINLTIPHKEVVLDELETGTNEVGVIGAANTLFLHESDDGIALAGHNTDAGGFLLALQQEADYTPKGKRVMVIGAGGAARAVIYALATSGAIEIAIINRNVDRAAALASEMAEKFPLSHIYALPLDPAAWPFNRNPRTLIVNATSFGLEEADKEAEFPVSAEALSGRNPERRTVFFDLLYQEDTPFLRAARQAEALAVNGRAMLIYQGALSFELWTGLPAPIEAMLAAI